MQYRISRMPFHHITPRQWEILVMTSEGMTGPILAKYLGISYGTIRNQKSRMYKRLGVHNFEDALKEAVNNKWIINEEEEENWNTP